ncbi:MAG: EamA family transporter [Pyrinomonadaceae bacterium]
MIETLSSLGLLMAGATSVSNVIKDVGAKKVLDHQEVIASTLWIRIFAAAVFVGALLVRTLAGTIPSVREGGPLFGIEAWQLQPVPTWLIYLSIEVVFVACSTILFFRAIQITAISLCMPYISFTPVFLIVTGYLMLGELPAAQKLIGVGLIFVGSIVMHRQLFAAGWLEPIRAIWRERGCLYMLLVGFINSITNPIDKKLVGMTDAFTQACAFGIGMVVFFTVLAFARRADTRKVIRAAPGWIVLAGTLEAVALLFQLSSHYYIDVVITISVKRAGIILTVLLGWLVFKERDIGDKLIAASVMLIGVLIIYLPLTFGQGLIIAAAAITGMAAALYLTRGQPADGLTAEPVLTEG